MDFQKTFTVWLQKIKLPSRNLPLHANHIAHVNHAYLNKFDPESEEDQLRSLSGFGWKKENGVLSVDYVGAEGYAPIYGEVSAGSLIEINKIEELQP